MKREKRKTAHKIHTHTHTPKPKYFLFFIWFQSIEFFLAKTVTHFVTDKPIDRDGNLLNVSAHYLSPSPLLIASAKTPSPAPKQPSSIHSVHDLNTSDDKQAACSRPRSRADAMVQRARTTTQPISPIESKSVQCAAQQTILPNPMQLAQNWGTPIWNTEYTLKFLEKVSLALKLDNQTRTTSSTKSSHHHHHKTANVKHLNGEYIKIESTQKVGRLTRGLTVWTEWKESSNNQINYFHSIIVRIIRSLTVGHRSIWIVICAHFKPEVIKRFKRIQKAITQTTTVNRPKWRWKQQRIAKP